MSVHGTCFDNGQSGRCNILCEQFMDGGCDAASDVIEGELTVTPQADIDETLRSEYNDVELFILRGEGKTDLELLTKALGY